MNDATTVSGPVDAEPFVLAEATDWEAHLKAVLQTRRHHLEELRRQGVSVRNRRVIERGRPRCAAGTGENADCGP